jgi:hypothetical protein
MQKKQQSSTLLGEGLSAAKKLSQANLFSSHDDDATDDRTTSALRVTRVRKE